MAGVGGLFTGGIGMMAGLMDRYGNNAQEAGTQRGKLARAKDDAWRAFRSNQLHGRGYASPYSDRQAFNSKLKDFDEQEQQINDGEADMSWLAPMTGALTSGVGGAWDQAQQEDKLEQMQAQHAMQQAMPQQSYAQGLGGFFGSGGGAQQPPAGGDVDDALAAYDEYMRGRR